MLRELALGPRRDDLNKCTHRLDRSGSDCASNSGGDVVVVGGGVAGGVVILGGGLYLGIVVVDEGFVFFVGGRVFVGGGVFGFGGVYAPGSTFKVPDPGAGLPHEDRAADSAFFNPDAL
jgi:hypothetical protein